MSLASGIDRPSQGYAPAMRRPDLKFSIGTVTDCMAHDPDDEPIITYLEKNGSGTKRAFASHAHALR